MEFAANRNILAEFRRNTRDLIPENRTDYIKVVMILSTSAFLI